MRNNQASSSRTSASVEEQLATLVEAVCQAEHALNNHLAPVVGYAELLRSDSGLSDDQRESLAAMSQGALAALEVLARLREKARAASVPGDADEMLGELDEWYERG